MRALASILSVTSHLAIEQDNPDVLSDQLRWMIDGGVSLLEENDFLSDVIS